MSESQRERLVAGLVGPGGEFEIVPGEVRGIPMRVYANGPSTLRDVVEASRAWGDGDFLLYGDERWSFRDHYELVAKMAAALRDEYGLVPGDRVAIAMRNYPEWSAIFWATQAAGIIAVPLNAWWTGPELVYALLHSGAKVLFADAERVRALEPHRSELRATSLIEVRGQRSARCGVRSFESVMDESPDANTLPRQPIAPDDDATILYTSGTTGRPKGAVGSHRNHLTNMLNTALGRRVSAAMANGGVSPESIAGVGPSPGVLLTFPMFHIAGLNTLCFGFLSGSRIATMYRWDSAEAAELIRREGLTSAVGVPTVMRELVEAGTDLAGLEGISMGGAPIPPDLVREIDRAFASEVAPGNGYGLTETTSAVVSNAGADYVARPDSVGRCVPGADLRVVDPETGDDVVAGRIGELWFRGPNVVRGYWDDPRATAEAFIDGWFRTGDLGYVSDGWVYVVDRMKDVVIRGGENVYCAEVEAALFEHPAVADAAVVGLAHPELGEEVAAVVNVRDGESVDGAEVRRHLATRLAAFKVPTHMVFWTEPLPRTSTGKVVKRDLRRHLARGSDRSRKPTGPGT
ncbi:class I adenylate-forming enzyme family protein [Parasphingorhabdus pacifica]